MRASGESGRLRVGYQEAAVLGRWSLTLQPRLPREYVVLADLVTAHAYWSTQRPIDLVLHLANVEWVWRDVQFNVVDNKVVVSVSDQPIVEGRRDVKTGEKHG